MLKKLNTLKLLSLIAGIVQIIYFAFILAAYIADITPITSALSPIVNVYILLFVLLFDLGIILAFIIMISANRSRNNLLVLHSMGNDVERVYQFGNIGLVVVDDNNRVVWTSELFVERRIVVFDVNIFEWLPELRVFGDTAAASEEPKVTINGRQYLVSHTRDTGLYVFRDVTESETAYQFAKDQSLAIGTISIDNYEELSKLEADDNTILLKLRERIQDYARDYGILFKKVRQDGYLMIADYKTLQKMTSENLHIIGQIREIGDDNNVRVSISGGIACGYTDLDSLNTEVTKALDIAMARGGDQIVVNQRGREMEIFGAQNEAIEKRSKVKVRVLSDAIIAVIKDSSNVLIVGHDDMDMDCLGSVLGVYAIAKNAGVPVHIVFESKIVERKTRQAFRLLFNRDEIREMTVDPTEAIARVKTKTLCVLADLHSAEISMAPKALSKAKKIAIIDHHRRTSDEMVEPFYQYFEPSASSASELVTELIYYSSPNNKFTLDPRIATIMLSGIILDTRSFKTKTTGIRTFEASMVLKEYGADVSKANLFLEDDFDEFLLVNNILSTLKTPFPGVVVCCSPSGTIVERAVLSKVANRCLELKDIRASFVIGQTSNKEVRISARSDSSVNVHVIMEKLNGGGHLASAAALFTDSTVDEAEANLLKVIQEMIHDAIIRNKKEN